NHFFARKIAKVSITLRIKKYVPYYLVYEAIKSPSPIIRIPLRADCRPGHARGSDEAVAVGLEKLAPHRERAERPRLPGQHPHREQDAARRFGLRNARVAQNPGRVLASGSGRAVPLYQSAVPGISTTGSARDFS